MAILIQAMHNPTIANDLVFASAEAAKEAKCDFGRLGAWQSALMSGERIASAIENPLAPSLKSLWTIEQINEKALCLQTEYEEASRPDSQLDKMRKIALFVFCVIGITMAFFMPWVSLGFGVAAAALFIYDVYRTCCRMAHTSRYRKIVGEFAQQWVSLGKALYASGPRATWRHFLEQQLAVQKGAPLPKTSEGKESSLLERTKRAFSFFSEQNPLDVTDNNLASLNELCELWKKEDPIGFGITMGDLFSGRSSHEVDVLIQVYYLLAIQGELSFTEQMRQKAWNLYDSIAERFSGKQELTFSQDDGLRGKPVFSTV